MVWPSYSRCSEVLPRLYLGNMLTAKNKRELTNLGITDLLTIETSPLELKELPECVKQYLFISAMDHPCQDIISDFEKSFNFIHEALTDPDRKVLVHCRAGVSRSASLVIAYVMKAKNIPYQAAYDFTLNAREIIQPNEGFVEQLKLYQKMKCNIDLANRDYRYICLMSLLFEYRLPPLAKTTLITEPYIARVDPSIFRISSSNDRMRFISSIINDKKNVDHILNIYFAKLKPNFQSDLYLPENAYKCTNCRSIIFYDINVLQPLSSEFQVTVSTNSNEDSHYVEDCGNIYIEPQPWAKCMNKGGSGIIKCFKCQYKLGDYNWKCEDSCVTPLRTCLEHMMLRDVSMVKISKKKVDAPSL